MLTYDKIYKHQHIRYQVVESISRSKAIYYQQKKTRQKKLDVYHLWVLAVYALRRCNCRAQSYYLAVIVFLLWRHIECKPFMVKNCEIFWMDINYYSRCYQLVLFRLRMNQCLYLIKAMILGLNTFFLMKTVLSCCATVALLTISEEQLLGN